MKSKNHNRSTCGQWLRAVLMFSVLLSSAATANEYLLDTGDVLQIRLLEKAEVSGAYIVAVDGNISLPEFGLVKARGETLRALETKLQELTARTIVNPSLSVQVAEYRPVYVVGDVADSGKYAFIPNLTVLQAVSLAKGFRRQVETSDRFARQITNLRAQQAVAHHLVSLAASRIRLARLRAEETDRKDFDFESELSNPVSNAAVDELLTEEQALFKQRNIEFKKRYAQEQEVLAARKREVDSFDAQIESQKKLQQQVASERAVINSLRKKGVVSNERLNALIREELRVSGQVLQTQSLLRQSETAVNETERALLALAFGRKTGISTEIASTKARIEELEALLKGEFVIMGSSDDLEMYSMRTTKPQYTFEIQRPGEIVDQKVQLDTKLMPGDTLVVIRNPAPLRELEATRKTAQDG